MHSHEWSGTRVTAALAALSDAGIPQSRMARLAGVNRSQVNRWSRGENRPGYDPVRSLAAAVWRKHPDLARELVEASGYAWAEPKDPPPPDVLTEELGQDTADRVRRELAKRGEAGRAVLAEFERVLSSPGEEAESEPGRAVS